MQIMIICINAMNSASVVPQMCAELMLPAAQELQVINTFYDRIDWKTPYFETFMQDLVK